MTDTSCLRSSRTVILLMHFVPRGPRVHACSLVLIVTLHPTQRRCLCPKRLLRNLAKFYATGLMGFSMSGTRHNWKAHGLSPKLVMSELVPMVSSLGGSVHTWFDA